MAVKPSSNNRFGRRSLVDDIAGVNKTNTKKTMSAADIIKKQHENVEKKYAQEAEEAKTEIVEATKETTEEPVEQEKQIEKTIETQENKLEKQPTPPVKSEVTTKEESIEIPVENDQAITKPEEKKVEIVNNPNTTLTQEPTHTRETSTVESISPASKPVEIPQPNTNFAQNEQMIPQNQSYPQQTSGYNNQTYSYQTNLGNGYQQYQQNLYGQSYNQGQMNYQSQINPVYQQPMQIQQNPVSEMHRTRDYNLFEDYPDINVRLPMKTGGDREMLKKSIMESGIADPIIVAPVQDVIRAFHEVQFPIPNYPENVQFIIIAGQNRRSLAKELGVELPFIIKYGLNKEQMDTIGLDTNLLNRQFSAMKPSEQVYIVNRRRALFEQNNTRNIRGKLSEITGYEKTYIYQLLSLVHVKKELLTDFVDQGYISVSGITHLVTVPVENQDRLYDYLIRNDIKKVMASQMKALLQDTTTAWTDTYLTNVMYPNQKKYSNITIRPDQYQGIIPEEDLPNASEIILKALRAYYQK